MTCSTVCTPSRAPQTQPDDCPLWLKLLIVVPFILISSAVGNLVNHTWDPFNKNWRERISDDEFARIVAIQFELQSGDYPLGSFIAYRDGGYAKIVGYKIGDTGKPKTLILKSSLSWRWFSDQITERAVNSEWGAHITARIIHPKDRDYAEAAQKFLMQ